MMEADSVHSTLERQFNPPIYSPLDYVARMRSARPKHPYTVKQVHFDFFLKYEDQKSNLSSIRPGKVAGDPTITDLCKIKYNPNGEIQFKIKFDSDWESLPQRRQIPAEPFKDLRRLYTQRLPITESKFKDLQSLKSVIDKDHHTFYDKLPYRTEPTGRSSKKKSQDPNIESSSFDSKKTQQVNINKKTTVRNNRSLNKKKIPKKTKTKIQK